MRGSSKITLRRHGWTVAGTAALLLVAAACGGSHQTNALAAGTGGPGASKGGVVVETHSGPLGTYLTDASGMTLYEFASDSPTKSTCTASCVTYWPPLTTKGAPSASGGAASSALGTLERTDGTTQVTYDDHPLYYFALDKTPGDTKGQGSNNFGAKWWLLAPSGKPITGTSGDSPATSSGSGSGGGW